MFQLGGARSLFVRGSKRLSINIVPSHSFTCTRVLLTNPPFLAESQEESNDSALPFQVRRVFKKQIVPIQTIIQPIIPNEFTEKGFLERLEKLDIKTSATPWLDGLLALVILVTPQYVTWFQNNPNLVEAILRRFAPLPPPGFKRTYPMMADVIVACVDGVTTDTERIPPALRDRPHPGFAFYYGRHSDIVPELANAISAASDTPELKSSLTFFGIESRKGGPLSNRDRMCVTLPLANTLFKTGQPSMLWVSRWTARTLVGAWVLCKENHNVKNVAIKMWCHAPRPTQFFIPARPLTPARRIVSGLGNIVRQVDFGSGGVGPASKELETAVASSLKGEGRASTLVGTWALVIPKTIVDSHADEDTFFGHRVKELITAAENQDLPETWVPETVGYWISHGASLCRVLSGGGGWGAKQGLLSLDPQTTYSNPVEARYDFSEEAADAKKSALGNVAEEGAYIQFFSWDNHQMGRERETHGPEPMDNDVFQIRSFKFGVLSSTIDDIPEPDPEPTTRGPTFAKELWGRFGCVSESGMFIHRMQGSRNKASAEPEEFEGQRCTKVDLPGSYIFGRDRSPVNNKAFKKVMTTSSRGGRIRGVKSSRRRTEEEMSSW